MVRVKVINKTTTFTTKPIKPLPTAIDMYTSKNQETNKKSIKNKFLFVDSLSINGRAGGRVEGYHKKRRTHYKNA